tara:strand:- start:241 stop:756 length:516 start_codon:yes stop_codon:yes gene_type:complete
METNDIIDFSEKFGLTYRDYPRKLSDEEKRFRIVCMFEEVQEYADAETMEDELDALVDLIYFALGTCYRHGYCFESAWKRVHEANMKKERAQNKSESKRDFELDVIKPLGWEPPDLTDIVHPPTNPALISISGGKYAKKRCNLTESQINDIAKEAIFKKASERENLPTAED